MGHWSTDLTIHWLFGVSGTRVLNKIFCHKIHMYNTCIIHIQHVILKTKVLRTIDSVAL